MGLTLRPVALIGLVLCVVATLSSPVYLDAALTNIGDADLFERQTADSNSNTHANINEARKPASCRMLSSLSDCSTGDVWCTGKDCSKQYWTVFKSTSDYSCHSLMGLDPNKRLGGPMHCVKNQEGAHGSDKCGKDWNGVWIVYDNDSCDDSGQTFQIPVQEADKQDFELPSGGMSVRYEQVLSLPPLPPRVQVSATAKF